MKLENSNSLSSFLICVQFAEGNHHNHTKVTMIFIDQTFVTLMAAEERAKLAMIVI